jgi:hypothetical protein
VRVCIEKGGGIAGMVSTATASDDALSPEEAAELRTRVRDAGLFDLEDAIDTAPGADRLALAVTVEDAGQEHRVLLREDQVPEAVGSLIGWIEALPTTEWQVHRPR